MFCLHYNKTPSRVPSYCQTLKPLHSTGGETPPPRRQEGQLHLIRLPRQTLQCSLERPFSVLVRISNTGIIISPWIQPVPEYLLCDLHKASDTIDDWNRLDLRQSQGFLSSDFSLISNISNGERIPSNIWCPPQFQNLSNLKGRYVIQSELSVARDSFEVETGIIL